VSAVCATASGSNCQRLLEIPLALDTDVLFIYQRLKPASDPRTCCCQGHALLTRHLGSDLPCPYTDYDAAWQEWYAAAYNLPKGQTVEDKFGAPFGAAPRFLCHVELSCCMRCFVAVAVPVECSAHARVGLRTAVQS
jgi:hypothetical protein